jgi:hypothetical protein
VELAGGLLLPFGASKRPLSRPFNEFLPFAFWSRKCKVAGYCCNQGFVFFFYNSNIKKLKKKKPKQ